MPASYFDERIAATYRQKWPEIYQPEFIEPTVSFLAGLAGSEPVGATIGDFATTSIDGTFRLVYLIRNTIANLTTQDAQVDCNSVMREVAAPGWPASWRCRRTGRRAARRPPRRAGRG